MKISKWLLAAGLVALATPTLAQSALDQIKTAGVLRIGTEGTYAPFTFHDSTGKLVGFDIEMAHRLAQDMRLSLELTPIDRRQAAMAVNSDAAHATPVIPCDPYTTIASLSRSKALVSQL